MDLVVSLVVSLAAGYAMAWLWWSPRRSLRGAHWNRLTGCWERWNRKTKRWERWNPKRSAWEAWPMPPRPEPKPAPPGRRK